MMTAEPSVLAVASRKGGVGKTSAAGALAGFLAESGPTLLVDTDPQCDATIAAGCGPADFDEGIYALYTKPNSRVQDHIIPLSKNLALLPADYRLGDLEREQAEEDRKLPLDVITRVVRAVRGDYHWVVIDTPPSMGTWTLNALNAAHRVLIPLQGADPFAYKGLQLLLRTIQARQALNTRLRTLGIFRARWDERITLTRQIWDQVKANYPRLAMRTVIPVNVAVAEAAAVGSHIAVYDAKAASAVAYQDLAKEIVERW